MADGYLAELSRLLGLPHYPKQGPFGRKEGALIGMKDNYIIAVGPAKTEQGRAAVGVLLRFKEPGDPIVLAKALDESPELSSRGEREKVGRDFVRWMWTYSLRKPKPPEVPGLVESLVGAAKHTVPPFDGRCESCQSAQTTEIVLLESVPVFYCESCQQKLHMDLDGAGRAYEEMSSNFPNGLLFGVLAAAGGSLAWGVVAWTLKRIFLWGAILIGYLVAWAVIKGMGKVTRAGQVLVFLLTIASVLFGDVIFYTLVLMEKLKRPFSAELVAAVMANFWQVVTSAGGGIASVLFAFVGAGYALYKARKPRFKVKFERLGQPSS